ncbi:MAG: vitamin K epoxide reductase family protein, partial [Streptosporangiaceae bacterium]
MASSKQTKTTPRSNQPKAKGGNGANGPQLAGRPAQRVAQNKAAQNKAVQNKKARDRARARELAEQRAAEAAAPDVRGGPPLWLQLTTLVLSIAGLGVSIYLTIEHFTGNTTLACSDKGAINCAAVTTSPESMVFGVLPVAVLGLAFFAFMVPATTPWAWRSRRPELALLRLASVVVGVGFILYLIYVEVYQVGAICLWCTSVHVMTFLLFALVAISAAVWG